MVKTKKKKTVVKTTAQEIIKPVVRKLDLKEYYLPTLTVLLIVAAFFIGRLSAQVSMLKGGSVNDTVPTAQGTDQGGAERKLDVTSLKARAKSLGLDTKKFDQCLDAGTMAQRVKNELAEGTKYGVTGTPTLFINGIMVVGAQPATVFESVIDAELKNGGGEKAAKDAGEEGTRQKLSLAPGYVTGEKNAKIKIVEFTDFECPFCERAFPTIQGLMQKYAGKISLEYKSFPLSFHANAQKAAEAALCAGEQGKFWEMHDNLFAEAN